MSRRLSVPVMRSRCCVELLRIVISNENIFIVKLAGLVGGKWAMRAGFVDVSSIYR